MFIPTQKNLDQLILSTDDDHFDGQRILQSNCMRDTTAHTQPKEAVSHTTFLWLSTCKTLRDYPIPLRDIDYQRILEFDWMRGATSQTNQTW